jgi:formyltetrahydrofolate deformylase
MHSCIIRVKCPNQSMLLYQIFSAISGEEIDVKHSASNVYNDFNPNPFVFRAEIQGRFNAEQIEQKLRSSLGKDAEIEIILPTRIPLVVFVTKESHCIGDLLTQTKYGSMPADILAVISNRDDLRPLIMGYSVPFYHVAVDDQCGDYASRIKHEEKMQRVLEQFDPQYLLLAKYMRVFTDEFVQRQKARIVNIHHSFLPSFMGSNPYQRAYHAGVSSVGATVHFVFKGIPNTDDVKSMKKGEVNGLDDGPIITQGSISIENATSAAAVTALGHQNEKTVLAQAMRYLFEGRVFVHGNRTLKILG